MVQDLLIQAYVYRHADPNTDYCALAAVPDLPLLDALRVFTHGFALRTPVFQQSCVDAQNTCLLFICALLWAQLLQLRGHLNH